jgi:histidyl-tRNA synthetase
MLKKKEIINKVKTTTMSSDVLSENYYQLQAMYEKAQEISEYYGFKPVYTPLIEPAEMIYKKGKTGTEIKNLKLISKNKEEYILREDFTPSLLRCYRDNNLFETGDPTLLYTHGSSISNMKEDINFELEIIGTSKAIADAIVIRTTYDIIEEYGFKDAYIDINSIGSSETRLTHTKEYNAYFKKNISKLCSKCLKTFRKNAKTSSDCGESSCASILEGAPNVINYLNLEGRKHFKEVLQYLEEMSLPYRINHALINDQDYGYGTIFNICFDNISDEKSDRSVLATGGRYEMSKYLNFKKELAGINSTIVLNNSDLINNTIKMCPKIHKPAKLFFIQLGFEAKLKSLNVMEILRKSDISVMQNLSKDSLTAQLQLAKDREIPYAIILGQKEAMNNTVIIRDMRKLSQDTVKISELCDYIKKVIKQN